MIGFVFIFTIRVI